MGKITLSQRRKYLLRDKDTSYALSWLFLPLGLFIAFLCIINNATGVLKGTLFIGVFPGIIFYTISHQRFFWNRSRQNSFIKKCIEEDKINKKIMDNARKETEARVNNVSMQKDTQSSGKQNNIQRNTREVIKSTPTQNKNTNSNLAVTILEAANKVVTDPGFGIPARNPNTDKYNEATRRFNEKRLCRDCKYANHKKNDVVCDYNHRTITLIYNRDINPSCNNWTRK